MFVVAVMVFSLSTFLNQALWLWVDCGNWKDSDYFAIISAVCWLFTYSNSVLNPIIYGFYSREFRSRKSLLKNSTCPKSTQRHAIMFTSMADPSSQEEVGMKWNQQTASLMKDLLPADTSTLQIMTLLTSRRVLEVKVHEIPSKPRFNELITFQTSLSKKRTKFKRVEPSGSRIERINFHLSRTARSFTQNNKEIIHSNIYCFPFL